jgi:hypothetical protein
MPLCLNSCVACEDHSPKLTVSLAIETFSRKMANGGGGDPHGGGLEVGKRCWQARRAKRADAQEDSREANRPLVQRGRQQGLCQAGQEGRCGKANRRQKKADQRRDRQDCFDKAQRRDGAKVAGRTRSMAARFKTSILPPLPPPFTAPPKKVSRSPVRRAVCAVTAAQKSVASGCESVSEADLREKMRVASAYIDSWLNRRLVFAPEVTAPEDAWAQIWLWLKRASLINDGRILSLDLFEALYADEMAKSR